MIPKFRAWDKTTSKLHVVNGIYCDNKKIHYIDDNRVRFVGFDNVIIMQSTGLRDLNDVEIFEGDVLKFNDEWDEYCHEGHVDGSVEGINYVEVVRGEACFEFGKTKYPESSLFILMEDEHLNFKDFIKSEDFEFEIIGNIYENSELLEAIK